MPGPVETGNGDCILFKGMLRWAQWKTDNRKPTWPPDVLPDVPGGPVMKKKKLIGRIISYMAILIVLLAALLAVYAFSSYSILNDELQTEATGILDVYGGQLKSRVTQMDTALKNLLLQNQAKLLLLKSTEEAKRFYASQDIHNSISDAVQTDKSVNAFVVADNDYGICVDAAAKSLGYWDRTALREYTVACASREDIPKTWQFVTLRGRAYLYKMYVYRGRAAAAYTTVDDFLATVPRADGDAQSLILTDTDGIIIGFTGSALNAQQVGANLFTIQTQGTRAEPYVIAEGQVLLHLRIRSVIVWNQTRIVMAVILAVIIITLIFGALIVRYISREMVRPMESMTEDMRRMDGETDTLRIKDDYGTEEFTQLKDTFNRLMDTIVHLRIQTYEKRIELREMELKSIRLQLRPHFFLNAITTLSSLGSQGKEQEMKTYADALSRNIRYMFKSGFHTVPVREEIRHVENYFAMQECKYPGCIFHFTDLPQELEEWRIPQMVIQTFVENEYKYALSVDDVLTILIHVSLETLQDEEMLLIRIEDDGKGYPQDVLQYMNGNTPHPANDGERIGLWGIRRMMALMYEREDLIQLANIEPHGCVNLIRVPRAPVHEYQEKTVWISE